jgi:hypothetical protein
MFLHTLGHNLTNHNISHYFGYSRERVSWYFHKVLKGFSTLHVDYLVPPSPNTPKNIFGKDHFDLYFKVNFLVPHIFLLDIFSYYCYKFVQCSPQDSWQGLNHLLCTISWILLSGINKLILWCNGNLILTNGIRAWSQVWILKPSGNTEGEIVRNVFSTPLEIFGKGFTTSYIL